MTSTAERLTALGFAALSIAVLAMTPDVLGYGMIDDAYISLRYADNLASGHGLVFNVGERVEGYSNFLWTVLVAGAIRVGAEGAAFAKGAGLLFAALAMLAAGRLHARQYTHSSSPVAQPIVLLGIAVSSSFACYSVSGLEASFYSFLLIVSSWFFLTSLEDEAERATPLILASMALALASLTRPETPVLFAFHLTFLGYAGWREGTPFPVRKLTCFAMPYLTVVGAFYLWRHGYYGYWLPNTYYAKVGELSLGLIQVGSGYAWRYGLYSGAILVVPGLLLRARFRASMPNLYLTGFVIAYVAAVVLEGGDHMAQYRFFAPLIPFVVLLYAQAGSTAIEALSPSSESVRRFGASALALSLAVGSSWALAASPSSPGITQHRHAEIEVGLARHWAVFGRWLERYSEPQDAIALLPIGAVGYYSKRKIIDMVGLTNEHIAHLPVETGAGYIGHEKYDNEYVLSLAPRFVLAHHIASRRQPVTEEQFASTAHFEMHKELLQRPDFKRHYRFRRVSGGPNLYFLFYEREVEDREVGRSG